MLETDRGLPLPRPHGSIRDNRRWAWFSPRQGDPQLDQLVPMCCKQRGIAKRGDAARIQQHDVVGVSGQPVCILLGHDNRQLAGCANRVKRLEYFPGAFRIERRRRLVEHKNARMAGQSRGDRHPLHLPS